MAANWRNVSSPALSLSAKALRDFETMNSSEMLFSPPARGGGEWSGEGRGVGGARGDARFARVAPRYAARRAEGAAEECDV